MLCAILLIRYRRVGKELCLIFKLDIEQRGDLARVEGRVERLVDAGR